MPSTDRAFRALARSEPEVVLALLRLAVPDFLPDSAVSAETVEDPKLELPPALEADLVARAGSDALVHVEGQGYGEPAFAQRVFRYHLLLTLRHPDREVRTVALWLVRPPDNQRLGRIVRGRVRIDVATVVLAELPASRLLAHPDTVCFAPGADAESLSDEELCAQVAHRLRARGAGWQRLLISVAVAAAAGRYDAMITAMTEAELDPPIIEDLVRYGRERGLREGVELGRREGVELAHEALLGVLAAREVRLSDAERERILIESDIERLRRWLRRAAVVRSAGELLQD